MWTTADITLGGGTKAERWTFIASFGLASPLGEHREAAVGAAAGRATIRSATSSWNIRVSDAHQGGQASPPSQRTSRAVPTL
jgi:hypothetical protein